MKSLRFSWCCWWNERDPITAVVTRVWCDFDEESQAQLHAANRRKLHGYECQVGHVKTLPWHPNYHLYFL